MSKFDDFLKQYLPTVDAQHGPIREPSARSKQKFEEALARNFPQTQVLSTSQMRLVILKIVTTAPGECLEITSKLDELRVSLESPHEGVVYGLLANMVDEGLLEQRFNETTTRTIYHITTNGSGLLNNEQGSIIGVSKYLRALWTT